MPEQVKVEEFEVFGQFRAALLKFAQAADSALTNVEAEISSTRTWLENEQRTYWENQLRKRTEAVSKARDAVRQKKLYKDVAGHTPNAIEEEKALRKCMLACEEAQQKIEAVRKWVPRLEREAGLYRGGVAHLSRTLSDDIPRAVALLDRLAATLEQYVQIEAPAAPAPEAAATAAPAESMSRGDEVSLQPAPGAANVPAKPASPDTGKPDTPANPSASPPPNLPANPQTPETEGGHVGSGR